ncbi:hypothetical protein O1L55_14500 [Streptomyces albulus]|nr:hypothetical protein [Streptomyces noursei]
MSEAGVLGCPSACSGAAKAMVPRVSWVLVRSLAWEMPKSMTFGPSADNRMFSGLTSRCTMPLPWSSASARTTPEAIQRTARSSSRAPCCTTSASNEGAATYSMAIQGRPASTSESHTRAV